MAKPSLPFGLSKNLVAALILGLCIIIFLFLKSTRPDAQVATDAEAVYTVRATHVTPSQLKPSLHLYGTVVAPGRARLTAAIAADVEAVHVLAGDTASAGSVLIELDPTEAEIALTQARAGLQQADAQMSLDRSQRETNRRNLAAERELLTLSEKSLKRAIDLRKQGLLSESDLDLARQNLQRQQLAVLQRELAVQQADAQTGQLEASRLAAEARLQRAELDLQRTRIRAGVEAAIIQTHVAPGDRVNPGSPLVDLYDLAQLEVRAQVPNRHIDALRRAQREKRTVAAFALSHNRRVPAHFVRLAASGQGGGQDAYFRLDEQAQIPIDARLTLELELPAEADAVALPFTAIYDLGRIFRIRNDRLESLPIETLGDYRPPQNQAAGGRQSLLVRAAGLEAGDEVVISQLPNAMTGLKVQVIGN